MTITYGAGPVYHVTGNLPRLIDQNLDAAVELAVKHSIETGGTHGILVTRHRPGSFTVALTSEIPFGTIQERDHLDG